MMKAKPKRESNNSYIHVYPFSPFAAAIDDIEETGGIFHGNKFQMKETNGQ